MTDSTFAKLQELFTQVVHLPAEEREEFLARIKAVDADTLKKLRDLLAADQNLTNHTAQTALPLLGQVHPTTNWVGQVIGAYKVREEIRSGGMGSVLLADRTDGVEQKVAIKLIRSDLLDESMRRRFQFERQVLAKLEYRDIARLIDAGELPDGMPYVVMEYVDGLPITQYADQHKLTIDSRLRLFLRVCEAVAYAHRNLIVHRDLKPSNILVSSSGDIKLLDFGIAKPLQDNGFAVSERTATEHRFFSPYNAAPEQLKGQEVNVACDVYGLGVLLYELLCGCLVFDFDGLTPGQIENAILHEEPLLPSRKVLERSPHAASKKDAKARQYVTSVEWSKALRGDLDSIALKCLRKKPEERYLSADALNADISNYLAGRAVEARRGRWVYRTKKFLMRHRTAAVAASIVMLTVIVSAAALWQQYQKATVQRDRAQRITQFLVDAFQAADPTHSLGAEITAKQILEHAAAQLKFELTDQPELKGELLLAIADVESSIGQPQIAFELLGLSDKEFARLRSVTKEQAAHLIQSKAGNQLELADFEGAQSTINQGLSSEQDAKTRVNLEQLRGWLSLAQGNYDLALSQLQTALADASSNLSANDKLTLSIRAKLGRAYLATGAFDKSLENFQTLLSQQQRFLPPSHPDTINTLRNISGLQRQLGKLDTSLKIATQAAELTKAVYGEDSLDYASALNDEAVVLNAIGQNKPAVDNYKHVLQIYELKLGVSHPRIAMVHQNIAGALELDPPSIQEVNQHFQLSIDIGSRAWPKDHPNLFLFRVAYGSFLNRQGRYSDAMQIVQPALESAERSPRLKDYDSYPAAELCAAVADYGMLPSNKNKQNLLKWLEESTQAVSTETVANVKDQAAVAEKLGVKLSKKPEN